MPTTDSRANRPTPLSQLAITIIATVEALAGQRPTPQLKGRVTASLLALISHVRAERLMAGAKLRSVRAQSPCQGVMEVSCHVRHQDRSHAIALRFEQRLSWVCTRLEIALPIGVNRSLVQINDTQTFPPPRYDR